MLIVGIIHQGVHHITDPLVGHLNFLVQGMLLPILVLVSKDVAADRSSGSSICDISNSGWCDTAQR
jgi:hypothetical protein